MAKKIKKVNKYRTAKECEEQLVLLEMLNQKTSKHYKHIYTKGLTLYLKGTQEYYFGGTI